ncbi:MAG: DMT family transporter [Pseudomonadota bacterium]
MISQATTPAVDRPSTAAGVLVVALFVVSIQDAIVKAISDDVSLWQFQAVRSAINLLLLLGLGMVWAGRAMRWPKRLWAVALRSLLLVITMVLFFGAIPFLPLADVAAGAHTFPIFVTLFALVLPGERVGWRRLSAVGVGIIGSLLVLRPGSAEFSTMMLMPLCSAVSFAGFIIVTRRLCREEHPLTLSYGVLAGYALTGGIGVAVLSTMPQPGLAAEWPYLFTAWQPLTLTVLAIIACASVLNISAQLCMTYAYQHAESSWLAPFEFTYLLFAVLLGGFVFGEWPDGPAIAGMLLIAAAGTVIALREEAVTDRVPDRTVGRR